MQRHEILTSVTLVQHPCSGLSGDDGTKSDEEEAQGEGKWRDWENWRWDAKQEKDETLGGSHGSVSVFQKSGVLSTGGGFTGTGGVTAGEGDEEMVNVHVEEEEGNEEEAQPAPKPVPKVSAWGARRSPKPRHLGQGLAWRLRPKPKVLPKQRPKEPAEPPPKPAEKARPKPRPDTGRQVPSKAMPAEKATLMKPRPKCRPVSATTGDEANWLVR
eukprot:s1883_g1.t1